MSKSTHDHVQKKAAKEARRSRRVKRALVAILGRDLSDEVDENNRRFYVREMARCRQ